MCQASMAGIVANCGSVRASRNVARRSAYRFFDRKITAYGTGLVALSFLLVCPRYGTIAKPWWLDSALGLTIFLVVLLRRRSDGAAHISEKERVASFFSKCAVIPYFAATIITLLLLALGTAGFQQYTRPISIFIQYLCIVLVIYAYIWEYGYKAIDKLFYVICIACVFEFSCGLLLEGPSAAIQYLSGETVSNNVRRFFELHDICLVSPLLVIYYLRVAKDDPHRFAKAFAAAAISFIGGKRIALAAMGIVYVVSPTLKFKDRQGLQVIEVLVQLALMAAVGAWVYVSSTSLFSEICSRFGIESMGRTIIYSYFQQFISNDGLSFGLGSGFCGLQLESLLGTKVLDGVNGVRGVHNDFLKIYIDCGLIGLIAFVGYFTLFVPAALGKRFGGKSKTVYYAALLYAFIVYMTDNAVSYTVFQTVLYLVLVPRVPKCNIGLAQLSKTT